MPSATAKQFQQCLFLPGSSDSDQFSSVEDASSKRPGTYKTSCFYLDSSGRASIALPLELQCPTTEAAQELIRHFENGPEQNNSQKKTAIAIQAKVTLTFGTGQAITAKVEGVTILSTELLEQQNDTATTTSKIVCNTEILLRVSKEGASNNTMDQGTDDVKTNLEIAATLTEVFQEQNVSANDLLESLRARHIGQELADSSNNDHHDRYKVTKLPPIVLHVALTHALTIAVRSVHGPNMGQTFLMLTLKHSNTHLRPVTVTSIALHPGVVTATSKDSSILPHPPTTAAPVPRTTGTSSSHPHTVLDMSHSVQWGYVDQCQPQLPLTLHPHHSFSAILSVDASNDSVSRSCVCPLSVTAVIGKQAKETTRHEIVAVVDAPWRTARTGMEPADAFRIEMKVQQAQRMVGSPLAIDLEVFNLSGETRNVMLLVDSGERKSGNKWAIISEKGGTKFGVGRPESTQQDLLPVDNALLLGDIGGHGSTTTQLRMLLLKEGAVDVPYFKLVDSRTGRRYSCIHKLCTVVND